MTRKLLIIRLLFISFLLVSCKNSTNIKTVNKKNVTNTNVNKTIEKKSVQSLLISKRYDSLIRTDNAVAFFMDFGEKNKEDKVKISTSFGDIFIKLYNDTPIHRASFIYLIKKKYFNETLFYRIAKNFVIQGGNTNDKLAVEKRKSIGGYYIPQEINNHKHTIGALAAAKEYEDNPNDYSNPYNFYIIVGQKHNFKTLDRLELLYNLNLSKSERNLYTIKGGAPHLDDKHTVFGHVYKGMDVVNKINKQAVDESDWPLEDIKMTVTIIE